MFKIELTDYQMGGLRGLLNYTIERVERTSGNQEYTDQLKSVREAVEKAFEQQFPRKST